MSGQEPADFPEDGWPDDAFESEATESEATQLSHVMY